VGSGRIKISDRLETRNRLTAGWAASWAPGPRRRRRLAGKQSLALHRFLERLEGLIDVVVADENLQAMPSSDCLANAKTTSALAAGRALACELAGCLAKTH